jgi:hypothetical protein
MACQLKKGAGDLERNNQVAKRNVRDLRDLADNARKAELDYAYEVSAARRTHASPFCMTSLFATAKHELESP